ncbi:MAG: HEPN domain-containing protein [Armatimonadota bacterium]|nr:HEPN domain-containing protein [Armatimonadota bacterium]
MEKDSWVASRKLAQAFWVQARADLATAVSLLDAGKYYASVFFSQQAAEKALKAAALYKLNKNLKGHHLIQMADMLNAPIDIMNAAANLNAEFLASRDPEACGGIPAQMYDREAAETRLKSAEKIIDWIKTLL